MERLSLPARRWVLALFCAAFVLIAWWVPYICTDDLQWGMDQGLRWWLQGLLNGRYVGNFFAVVMCRFPLAKALIMGLGMFALPLAMAAVAAPRGERVPLSLFFAGCALLLIMPRVMWLETYGWVSAFGNYVVPTLLFFLWLLILDHVSLTRSRLGLWSALLLALTLAMGLFVENLTVLFLGGSLLLALYSLWDRALRLPFFACLLGSALGAAVMFLNGVFADLTGTGSALNGLRQLTFAPGAGLLEMARGVLGWYFGRLLPISFLRGVHMALPLGILIACTFWRGKAKALALTGVLPLVCYFLFSGSQVYNTLPRVLLSACCWLLPVPALLLTEEGQARKLHQLLLYLAAPLSLLPLAISTTLGQRLYFFPTAVLAACALRAARPLIAGRPGAVLCALAAGLLLAGWGWGELQAARCTWLRAELTAQAGQTGADTLVLPTDRFDGVLWTTRNPPSPEYAQYYRQFYGVPHDATLIFLPPGSFERWPEVDGADWEKRQVFPPSDDYTSSLP